MRWHGVLLSLLLGWCVGCGEGAPAADLTLLEVLESEVEYPALSRSSYWDLQRHGYSQEWVVALQLCRGWSDRPNCQPVLDLEVQP